MIDYANYKGFKDPTRDRSVLISLHNKPLTAALFIERASQWADIKEQRRAEGKWDHEPLYTLGEQEINGLPSAYKIYMSSVDEYEAALKLVGSIFHWQELCKKSWFMEHVIQWREHMALRDFSLAKRITLEEAEDGDGPAARHLLNFSHKVINPPAPKRKEKTKDDETKESGELDELYNKVMKKDGPDAEAKGTP
jgi:hypothetical protein